MGRRKNNILLSMNANEKKFMRKITEKLKAAGYPKAEIPERKREALEEYRGCVRMKCAPCVTECITEEVDKMSRFLTPKENEKKEEGDK